MRKIITIIIFASLGAIFLSAKNNSEPKVVNDPNTFRIVNGAEPSSLDPVYIQGAVEDRIYTALFEGLLNYNYRTGRATPGIAETLKISDDKIVYTFYLRKTFWSDGTPVTSQTFIDSWKRVLNPDTQAPYAFFMEMLIEGAEDYHKGRVDFSQVGVKAIDKYTLEVTLAGPIHYALDAFAHSSFGITPVHIIEKFGKDWTNIENIVTNGSFILKKWIHNDKIIVEKNPNYWDAENVKLDKVVFYAIEDEDMGYRMFINNEVDWTPFISKEIISRSKSTKNIILNSALTTHYYILNIATKPLNDVRVRRALSMAINRVQLVREITKAGQIPAIGLVPYMDGYNSISGESYNIEKAKELLAQAGYPNGKGFPEFPLIYNSSEYNREIASFVKLQWEKNLGIKVVLKDEEWNTWLCHINNHDFKIAKIEWSGDYQDPNTFLDMFVTGAEMNFMEYSNPKYDSLIKTASTMLNGTARTNVLMEAEKILCVEDQALIPLYFGVLANGIDTDKWGGWSPNVLDVHPVKTIYNKQSK